MGSRGSFLFGCKLCHLVPVLMIIFGLVGCMNNDSGEDIKVVVKSDALSYEYQANMPSGESISGDVNQSQLWDFITNYCDHLDGNKAQPKGKDSGYVYPSGRFGWTGTSTLPEFTLFRQWTCIGDVFSKWTTSDTDLVVKKTNEYYGATWPYSGSSESTSKEKVVADIDDFKKGLLMVNQESAEEPEQVRLKALKTSEQIAEIKQFAFNAYLSAIYYALSGADDYQRELIYCRWGDSAYIESDYDNASAPNILLDMFETLPTLITKIKELKYELVELSIARGVAEGKQWESQEYGRNPAMRHLFGTVGAIAGEIGYSKPDFSFLPKEVGHVPANTNTIKNAVFLLGQIVKDVSSYIIVENEGTVGERYSIDIDELETDLMAKAEEFYSERNLEAPETITGLVNEYDTNRSALVQAVDYIYLHMKWFPRLPSLNDDSETVVSSKWGDVLLKAPWRYYTKGFKQRKMVQGMATEAFNGDNIAYVNFQSLPKEVGLYSVLSYLLEQVDLAKIVIEETQIDPQSVCEEPPSGWVEKIEKAENAIPGLLAETERQINNIIGNKKITTFGYNNASMGGTVVLLEGCDFKEGQPINELKLIPLRMGNGVNEYNSYTCDRLSQTGNEDCEGYKEEALDGQLFAVDENRGECRYGFETIPLGEDVTSYVILERDNEGEHKSKWEPVAIFEAILEMEISSYGGEIDDKGQLVADFNLDRLEESECLPLAYFTGREECIPIDWVPSIDNEIIDGSGNSIEESYRHYLNLARIAVNGAREIRSQLEEDLLTETHEKSIKEQRLESAVDNYFNSIHQICGESITYDEDEFDYAFLLSETTEDIRNNLTSLLNKKYGCDDTNIPESKYGTIQCSQPRNCLTEAKFAQPGPMILKERLNLHYIDTNSTIIPDASGYTYTYDKEWTEFERPEDDNDYYEEIDEQLSEKILDLRATREEKIREIKHRKILYAPDRYEYGNESGAYFSKLREFNDTIRGIESDWVRLDSAYKSAQAAIESTKTALKKIESEHDLIEGQYYGDILISIAEKELALGKFSSNYQDQCKEQIDVKMNSGDYSYENVKVALEYLNRAFEEEEMRVDHPKEFFRKEKFGYYCMKAAEKAKSSILKDERFAPIICERIENDWGVVDTWENPDGSNNRAMFEFRGGKTDWLDARICGNYDQKIYIRCDKNRCSDKKFTESMWGIVPLTFGENCIGREDFGSEEKYDWRNVCNHNAGYMYYFDWKAVESTIVTDIQGGIRGVLEKDCNVDNGCSPSTTSANQTEECKGPAAAEVEELQNKKEQSIRMLKALSDKLEDAKIGEELRLLTASWIDASEKWITAGYDLESKIRRLNTIVGELTQLENEQIYAFERFINELNEADASSYSSLSEWNERFDFRKKQYQQKLRRAKIATWIAQRAIEFKFGIDLKKENEQTIYGDTPKEWVNRDLYLSEESTCGKETGEDGETKITGCLRDEEKIDSYLQKLEDYVESYGNSPSQNNWWFHEDDDIAVISLRHHLNLDEGNAYQKVDNLLYFTEEMEMDKQKLEEKYDEVLSLKSGEDSPQYWETFGGAFVTENVSVSTDDMPQGVIGSRRHNEQKIIEDMSDDNTSDILSLNEGSSIGESRIEQRVDLSVADRYVDEIGELAFSLYVKEAISHEEQCDETAGEIYNSITQRCGIPCVTEDEDDDVGNCPSGMVCLLYEQKNTGSSEIQGSSVCTWCTSGESCEELGGTAVSIQTQFRREEQSKSAQKNIPAYSNNWHRQFINTVDQLADTDDLVGVLEMDEAVVSISDTETRNLVEYSEYIDDTRSWSICSDEICTQNLAPRSIISPEYVENGADVAEISVNYQGGVPVSGGKITVKSEEIDLQNQGNRNYVASIWMKDATVRAEDWEGITRFRAELSVVDDGMARPISVTSLDLDGIWKRYEISGVYRGSSDGSSGSIQLVLLPEENDTAPDGEVAYQIAAWGAQIEGNTDTATPYISTGKSMLYQSENLLDATVWSGNGLQISIENVKAPNRKKYAENGVFSLIDDDFGAALPNFVQQTINDSLGSGSYTFSVWMKAGSENIENARIEIDADVTNGQDCEVSNLWSRCQVTSSGSVTPTAVRIYPNSTQVGKGQKVFVWGPQLEKGMVATGYQSTQETIENVSKHWHADVELVGLQLEPIDTYTCDQYGDRVSLADLCTNCPSYTCGEAPDEYVRNTYFREHYPAIGYELISNTSNKYPLPHQIDARMTGQKRSELFRGKLIPVDEDEDGMEDYRITGFSIDLDEMASGELGSFGVIAPENFNYRINNVGVNIVGTDVIDCEQAKSEEECAANPWIRYDMRQEGDNIRIRNHHKETSAVTFTIPDGAIHSGKAWSAEQIIGFPLSGAHQTMMSQIQKVSLMGRPLEGHFDLVLYDDGNTVDWNAIEDVQLVIGYHYWSHSDWK